MHTFGCYTLSNRAECFLHILENIVNMFRTDRKPDGIWADTLVSQLFFCTLTVCRGSRVDDQGFDIRYVG